MPYPPHKIDYSLTIPNVYTMFYEHYPFGFSAIKDVHDFWECVYIKSGKLRVVVDNRIYDIGADDLIIYNPLEIHTFTVLDEGGTDIFIFSFDAEGNVLKRLAGRAFHMSAASAGTARKLVEYVLSCKNEHINPHNTESVPKYMAKNKAFREDIMAYVFTLLFLVSNDEPAAPLSNTASIVLFGELSAYMEKNLYRNMQLCELSRVCGASQTSIQNIFRKYTGMSAHKYYTALKLNTALKYINGGMSVTGAAEKLGFSSQAHFTKVFKKEIGCSPTAYRRSLKG